jgi:hypothetical protein
VSINTFTSPDVTNATMYPEPTNAATNGRNQILTAFTDVTNQLNTEVRDKINPYLTAAGTILRQAIINGNFAINQRVVSGTVTLASGVYGHDRWKAGATGCTYTFATSANITTITITAGSLQQVIEGSNLITGTYVLSWAGSAQGKIDAGSYGTTGITGSATGGTNLTVEFGSGTLSKVQFNFGTDAIPFSPKSLNDELLACQRYYEKSYALSDPAGTSIAGVEIAIAYTTSKTQGFSFKVRKRAAPTVTIYSRIGTINKIGVATTGADAGTSVTAGGFERGVPGLDDSGTGFTVGVGYSYHWTADAEL